MAYTLRDLAGTVVAITGATSGIGRATAEQLVELGAKVALGARNADRLAGVVEQLGSDNAVAVPMDVRSVEDNQALIDAAVTKFGKLDSRPAEQVSHIGSYRSEAIGQNDVVEKYLPGLPVRFP